MVNKVTKPVVDKKEEKYRNENFPDVNKIVDKKLLCTSCNISVKPQLLKGNPKVHPFMDTLLCDKCFGFFGDGDFSTDEDGSDKYCRWCGQGGTLYLCSKCTAGFCKRCIKRNLPRSVWKEVEDDDWQCLCCNVAPLYELRAQAWASLEYVKANFKDKNDSSSRKRKMKADSDESDAESVKKSKKSDDNEEAEEETGNSRRAGRDKNSKKKTKGAADDDETEEEEKKSRGEEKKSKEKLKTKQFKYARTKITNILADVVKMMDVTKRKAEDFKKKKVSAQKVNDLESVLATADNIKTMLLSVEDLSSKLRETVEDFTTKFEKSLQEQNGLDEKKKTAGENGDLDTSDKKDKADDSEGDKEKDSTDVEMKETSAADDSPMKQVNNEEYESKSDTDDKTTSEDTDKTIDPNVSYEDVKETDTKETEISKSESN